ncbi:MAG: N-6 DNA methylase [Gammaproteobacteria bacterium]|nr:N-6 DNA methylase [Gammaproteobacteria bacterium]
MPHPYLLEYQTEVAKLRRVSGSGNESVVRRAFENCLQKYCKQKGLTLVAELACGKVYPDGTVVDELRMVYGHWEAKDIADDIDRAITVKTRKNYPDRNIIYENTGVGVLIQNGEEVMRVDMRDNESLARLIRAFFAYQPPAIAGFRKAVAAFKDDLPDVLRALREAIEQSLSAKPAFRATAEDFLKLCQTAINPAVESADVREMLIQHILTKDIFLKVFGEDQFHKENNIARRLEQLEDAFFTGATRRATVDRLRGYYGAITAAAAGIDSHAEKQKFLKAVYEDFYQIYNPQAADRLGVVYTPGEIVNFMIRAADELVRRHFGRRIFDKGVHILDPAAGTGTYITDLIDFIPEANLQYKYQNEIHANEVGILPYYIANLNIEYTYKQKMGAYMEFPNICFVDTLDNLSFADSRGQSDLIGTLTHENMARVKQQNAQKISVIIGNPPYNANQRNENDNNKNREYPAVDARIKETYIAASTAQKTKQYDMYKRFIRWASDRLGDHGVLAFITNRSYIDARNDDGFRKIVAEEFDEIYIVDLGGDLRKRRDANPVSNPNVFGIMTGVAIGFFVRKGGGKRNAEIWFTRRGNTETAADKLAFLTDTRFEEIAFEHIVPDQKHNWLGQTDNDFDSLLCVADKATKLAKSTAKEKALFKLFSLGVLTARDPWVCDFDKKHLAKKVKGLIKGYESARAEFGGTEFDAADLGTEIKWTRHLKNQLTRNTENKFDSACIRSVLFRPFVEKYLYFSHNLNEMQYQMPQVFPKGGKNENTAICFNRNGSDFYALACNQLPDYHFTGDSQCLPLYRYDQNGNRVSNLTAWGVQQFRARYADSAITVDDIFHYTYAALHSPAWRRQYAVNLRQEFPRLPFHPDFHQWARHGKALLDLHLNFTTATPHPLQRRDKTCAAGDPKLRADKPRGKIIIDGQTELAGIPAAAWQYQLGPRSALEWVLDQHKQKTPRDPTIRAQFNAYQFADHKERVIDLLLRVCTVSVATVDIIREMEE